MHAQCTSNCPLVSSSVCPHIHAKSIYQCFKIEGEEKDERYWRTRRKWGKIHFTSFMELKKYKENFQLLTSNDEYMKNWGYLLFSWLPQEWRPDIEIGYLKLLRFAQMLHPHHRIIHRIRKLKICMNLNLTRSNTFMILFKLISFPLIKKPWIFAKGMNRNGFSKREHECLSLFLKFDPNYENFLFPALKTFHSMKHWHLVWKHLKPRNKSSYL